MAKTKSTFGNNATFTFDGFAQHENLESTHNTQSEVREAYLDFSLGLLDIRLGKQIIAWGRADKLNPTDNLTPRDYTLLVPEDEEQRLGTSAAVFNYPFSNYDYVLTGVWMPRIHENVVPLNRPANAVFTASIPDTDQVAIRLNRTGGDLDWSVSYLDGVNLNPEVQLTGINGSSLAFRCTTKRCKYWAWMPPPH
ncbi:MAG: hypothetical protein HC848_01965 [Limnobacter sp.]|nr:hypothetical protein [Limnobacter sp.]